MTMRFTLKDFLLFTVFFLSLSYDTPSPLFAGDEKTHKQLNVLFIAIDDLNDLEVSERSSYGVGLRLAFGQTTIRLETANGEEGPEWFLMVGNPW